MALLTNAGSAATVTWTVPKKSFDNKERIVDVLTCRETVARKGSGDTLVFTSTMGMPLVTMLYGPRDRFIDPFTLGSGSFLGSRHTEE